MSMGSRQLKQTQTRPQIAPKTLHFGYSSGWEWESISSNLEQILSQTSNDCLDSH